MRFGAPFPDLSRRADVPERMDDPVCDEQELLRTVRRFRLLNRLVTRYRLVLDRWLLREMLADPGRTYRVADLGAGGCDIPAWLIRRAGERGLRLSVLAVESDPRIADYARRAHGGTPGLTIACRDATDLRALGPVDYVIGNHFLHHLTDRGVQDLLAGALALPIRRFVFMDIRRTHAAYLGVSVLAALLFPRTFVGTDGRRSVRRGFRVSELKDLLAEAGIRDRVQVHTLMPARIVIVGNGPG